MASNLTKLGFLGSIMALLGSVIVAPAEVVAPFEVDYVLTNYSASVTVGSVTNKASGVYLGNFRGLQNWRDLVIANKDDNTVSVRLCLDNGTFSTLTNYAVGLSPIGVRAGDFDGDQFEDIVVANSGTNTISVLLNQGSGTSFGLATEYVVSTNSNPGPVAVSVADVDGNGSRDIVVANSLENTVAILLKTAGLFVLSTNYTVGANPTSVQAVDLNDDGYIDILTANKDDGTLTLLINQSNNTFVAQTETLFPGGDPQPVAATTRDFNTDGFTDIATANYNSNTVSILLGSSNGVFTISTNIPVGTNPSSLLSRDLNHDELYDLAVTSAGSGTVDVVLNTGTGFSGGLTFAVGSGPAAIAGSNFDNYGLNDLAVANNGDNTISILNHELPLVYSAAFGALEDKTNSMTITSRVYPGRTATYTILSLPASGVLTTNTAPVLTYAPTNHYFGSDSFTYQITDGTFTSAVATVTLNVAPVNDAPGFSLNTNVVTLQNYGTANKYSNMVASTSMGPANESSQKYSFLVTLTNSTFFTGTPTLGTNGVLTATVKTNATGTNTFSVRIRDTGGTTSGGTNISGAQTISVIAAPNPYPAIKGTYSGLFSEAGGVSNQSSGSFNFLLKDFGTFSGKLILGRSFGMSGRFDSTGQAQVLVNRGSNLLTVNLTLDLTAGGTEQVTGTVTDGTWTANLRGDRLTFNALTNPAPLAGTYTMILPGSNDPSSSPGGDGYGLVTVETSGRILLSGLLADGRAYSQITYLSKNGEWPLYVPLFTGNGSLFSWITFSNQFNSSFAGNLSWIKTGAAGGSYYPLGFTNNLFAAGSTFIAPAVGTRILSITNGITTLDGGNILSPLVNNIVLQTNNVISVVSGQATNLVLNVSPTTGKISGTFRHPVTGVTAYIKGTVFQQQNTAAGYLLGPSQSGGFLLQGN